MYGLPHTATIRANAVVVQGHTVSHERKRKWIILDTIRKLIVVFYVQFISARTSIPLTYMSPEQSP